MADFTRCLVSGRPYRHGNVVHTPNHILLGILQPITLHAKYQQSV